MLSEEARRLGLYLALAFGLAWATALVIYRTGGLADSPELISGTPVSLALVLLAGPVMWSPALANLLTRLLTGEGWQSSQLRPRLKQGWPYWIAAWLLPGSLTVAGLVVYFLLFPSLYDPELGRLQEMLQGRLPSGVEMDLRLVAGVQVLQALLIAPLINSFFTFGEEFGWRAYLQPKLAPLGPRRAVVLTGLIWGVWHWPIILMGHNYGLDYPGAPYLGPLAMVWFTLMLSVFLGWATWRGGSVWPAVIGHAAVNGIAGLGVIFARGQPNPLLGPMPTGLIGGIGFTLLAAIVFFWPGAWESPTQRVATQAETG